MTETTRLTDLDRHTMTQAAELAFRRADIAAICEHTGHDDTQLALAAALGEAQCLLGELLVIIERLTEDAPNP